MRRSRRIDKAKRGGSFLRQPCQLAGRATSGDLLLAAFVFVGGDVVALFSFHSTAMELGPMELGRTDTFASVRIRETIPRNIVTVLKNHAPLKISTSQKLMDN